jgi:hypothetical protein
MAAALRVHRCRFAEWTPAAIVAVAAKPDSAEVCLARDDGSFELIDGDLRWTAVERVRRHAWRDAIERRPATRTDDRGLFLKGRCRRLDDGRPPTADRLRPLPAQVAGRRDVVATCLVWCGGRWFGGGANGIIFEVRFDTGCVAGAL